MLSYTKTSQVVRFPDGGGPGRARAGARVDRGGLGRAGAVARAPRRARARAGANLKRAFRPRSGAATGLGSGPDAMFKKPGLYSSWH
jgi:hypothetical protein